MTEKQRMLQGELYDPLDRELVIARREARDLTGRFNRTESGKERQQILRQLLGSSVEKVWIEPPFQCDYGTNIRVGRNVFMNFNCVILDPAQVTIGDNVLFGPGVHLYTATHPMDAETRRSGQESARPITIAADVWVGGGAMILPGVSIGEATVIGAGSVVTRSVPAGVFAAGNPCRVIRQLEPGEVS